MPALAENGVEFVTKYDSTSTKKRRVKLSDPNQNHSQDIELINGRHQTGGDKKNWCNVANTFFFLLKFYFQNFFSFYRGCCTK